MNETFDNELVTFPADEINWVSLEVRDVKYAPALERMITIRLDDEDDALTRCLRVDEARALAHNILAALERQ